MVKRVKIFVFGTSSAGKTSVINLLTDKHREVGKEAKGCTLKSEACSVFYNGIEFIFYDTAGLNEGAGDPKVSSKIAVENLINLLKEFEDGFNLVMYVRKISAIGALDDKNYKLIKTLVQEKLPLIIVNTGAENSNPVNKWWEDNRDQFLKAKYTFAGGVSVCTIVGTTDDPLKKALEEVYKIQRKESKEVLWSCIEKNRLFEGQKVIVSNSAFWEVFLNAIDFVSNKTGLRALIGRSREKANLIKVFMEHEFTENEAEKFVNKFYVP